MVASTWVVTSVSSVVVNAGTWPGSSLSWRAFTTAEFAWAIRPFRPPYTATSALSWFIRAPVCTAVMSPVHVLISCSTAIGVAAAASSWFHWRSAATQLAGIYVEN